MPIKGLTDRVSVQPRWPRIGYLRKGGPKKQGKRWGPDLDYFRFTSDDPLVAKAFDDVYGGGPDRLEVYLPYKTAEENFETAMEEWGASGLVHRCDGETCILHRTNDGTFSQDPIPCPYASGAKTRTEKVPGCVKTGKLHVILPGLIEKGFVGQVTLLTGSYHDLVNIIGVLFKVEEVRTEGLQGVPFTLRRYRAMVSTPMDNGKRVRTEKSLVALVPAPTWYDAHLALARSAAFALPDGVMPSVIDAEVSELERVEPELDIEDVDVETGEIIEDEPKPKPEPKQEPKAQPKGAKKPNGNGKTWPAEMVQAIVKMELADKPPAAVQILNRSNGVIDPGDSVDIVTEWALQFKMAHEAGADHDEAAKMADEAIKASFGDVDGESAEATFEKAMQDNLM